MGQESNHALCLQASLKAEVEKLTKEEGATLNQFINVAVAVAVAEKLSALHTPAYFRSRANRADTAEALDILERAGIPAQLRDGDEIPPPMA